jgi:hypothetical protein
VTGFLLTGFGAGLRRERCFDCFARGFLARAVAFNGGILTVRPVEDDDEVAADF